MNFIDESVGKFESLGNYYIYIYIVNIYCENGPKGDH